MITKETFMSLVYAGRSVLKPIIDGEKLIEKYNHSDIHIPAEVFEFFEMEPNYSAFMSLVLAVKEMDVGVEHSPGLSLEMYCDAVSMCLFKNENTHRYLELVYEYLTTNTIPEELCKIENETSPDIHCWVRRKYYPPHPLFKDLYKEKLYSIKQDEQH